MRYTSAPRNFHQPSYQNPARMHLREVIRTAPVDMMTGRIDQWPDQITAATESSALRRGAAGLAIMAVAACLHGGPGVAAPRYSDSSAVIVAPDVMPRHKR